jgi:hypothetical protein
MPEPSSARTLERIMQQVDVLSADEQLRLAAYLVERARVSLPAAVARKWSDLRGLYSHPMLGEDAQAWVARTRKDADDHRNQSPDTAP